VWLVRTLINVAFVIYLLADFDHSIPRELHLYRGHEESDAGYIMGHEFTGLVVEAGPDVRNVQVGDRVVSPFTTSWYVDLNSALHFYPRS
jgi:hypothetical protein